MVYTLSMVGHPGVKKTAQVIDHSYYIPGLRAKVTDVIRRCNKYTKNKISRHLVYR